MPPSTAPASSHATLEANVSSEPSRDLRLVRHVHQGASGPGLSKTTFDNLTAGQALRMFRVRAGMTIGRAANNYGIAADTWANYEHGRSKVDADALLWVMRMCEEIGR